MTLRGVVVGALIFGFAACGLAANLTFMAVVDAVNARLPEEQNFEALGWHAPKTLALQRAYRRLYPGGHLLRRQGFLMMAALGCLIAAGVLMGFPAPALLFFASAGAVGSWLMFFRGGDGRQ